MHTEFWRTDGSRGSQPVCHGTRFSRVYLWVCCENFRMYGIVIKFLIWHDLLEGWSLEDRHTGLLTLKLDIEYHKGIQ
jgi:hypothetical protein